MPDSVDDRLSKILKVDGYESLDNYIDSRLENTYARLARATTMEEMFRAQGTLSTLKDFLTLKQET
ncbi:hypothetical protein N9937_02005 [bacterium]|nr:hypothetical protein [bacterium]